MICLLHSEAWKNADPETLGHHRMNRAHLSYSDRGLYAQPCTAKEFQNVRFAAGAGHKKPLLREKFKGDGMMLGESGWDKRYPLVLGELLATNDIRDR